MLAVIVNFRAAPGQEAALLAGLKRHSANSLNGEEGCERFDVLADPDDAASIWLYEVYRSADDFETHKTMPYFIEFGKISEPMIAERTVRVLDIVAG